MFESNEVSNPKWKKRMLWLLPILAVSSAAGWLFLMTEMPPPLILGHFRR